MSYQTISKIFPKKIRESYKILLEFTGRENPDRIIGFLFVISILISALLSVIISGLFILNLSYFLLVFVSIFILIFLLVYLKLWFAVEGKANYVDKILPDALQLMAMNIKSGLTTDRALIMAARPEFGALEEELRKVGKDIMGGSPIRGALLKIPKRIKSKTLDKSIKLIVEGIESGGELANLLDQTASDIQKTTLMQKEISATVMMYAIFIFFAAGIGAPLIFAISTHLVSVLGELSSKIDVSAMSGMATSAFVAMGASGAKISVSESFLNMYSVLSLIVTSIFGGLIIGLIKDGKEKTGFKYIPILLIISLLIFFVTKFFVAGLINI